MPPAECSVLLAELSRFDEAIDHLDPEAVVAGALGFLEDRRRHPYASMVLQAGKAGKRWLVTRTPGRAPNGNLRHPLTGFDLAAAAVEGGRTIYLRDLREGSLRSEAFIRRLPAGIRALAVLPLRGPGSLRGTLNVGAAEVDGIPSGEHAFLEAAARRLAAALRAAFALKEIEAERRRRGAECSGPATGSASPAPAEEEVLIGQSPAMRAVIARIERVAPTAAGVLVLGESGTGKELAAQAIHRLSRRAERPLVKVNCAGIPRGLYESEFFGHAKGAFTGAVGDRTGRFEAADGGTLFLDEIGEIPLGLQGKLLRVLQAGEFERVGEDRTRRVDVRIIASTNRRLAEEVRAGRFREDLYYRLNVFPIEMAPLRERREDIPLLAEHFVDRLSRRLGRPAPRLSPADLEDLAAYAWPGNVRELRNVIERALILSPPGRLAFEFDASADRPAEGWGGPEPPDAAPPPAVLSEKQIRELQRRNMVAALERSGWKIYGDGGAARMLGINPTTLIERMRRLGIRRPA